MSIFLKDLGELTESDIQALIDNQVSENRQLEYKKSLPGSSDSEKKEFLADVSSFANASGGNLLYGVEEERGVPKSLKGITSLDLDQDLLRLNNMLQTGISPRIPGLRIRLLRLTNSSSLFIIRIPRSWVLPHMVSYQNSSKFYSRNAAGKYPLDIQEIRGLFLGSQSLSEKIRNFRAERISNIIANETPVEVENVPKIVLHLIPLNAFDFESRLDLSIIKKPPRPIYASGWGGRHNFDGYLSYSMFGVTKLAHTYVQFFRNGVVEAVEAFMLGGNGDKKVIPSVAYEKELLTSIPEFLGIQKNLGVELPILITLSLIGVKGYTMAVNNWFSSEGPTIEKDMLILEPVILEKNDEDIPKLIKPIFDSIWNASGWPEDRNYKDGKWVGS